MRLILLFLVAMGGVWLGASKKNQYVISIDNTKEFPLTEQKSFVFVLYAHNQSDWCKRALRSIFEQDYPHYRLVMVDDASLDTTESVAKEFIVANNQEEKVIFIKNESFLGPVGSLYRAIDHCLDREIVIPLEAKDWFTSPNVLKKFNLAYQNPDVWLANSWGIEYPSYKICDEGPISFYAALFKEIRYSDLFQKGQFIMNPKVCLKALHGLAGGRVKTLFEPLWFLNFAPKKIQSPQEKITSYQMLTSFPEPKKKSHLVQKDEQAADYPFDITRVWTNFSPKEPKISSK